MRIVLLLLCALSAGAQTYITNTWNPAGCTSKSHASMPYNDLCTPPNQPPLGTFVPATDGSWFVDTLYGSRGRLMHRDYATTSYQTQTPWSLTSKYVLTQFIGTGAAGAYSNTKWLLNGKTLAEMRQVPSASYSQYTWSGVSNDYLYYVSGQSLYRHSVSANTNTLVETFDGTGGTVSVPTRLNFAGNADMNRDDWIAFGAGNGNPTSPLTVVNGITGQFWQRDIATLDGMTHTLDFVIISKGKSSVTGRYYVLVMSSTESTTTPSALYWFDETTGLTLITKMEDPHSGSGNHDGAWTTGETGLKSYHSDTVELEDGTQAYVRTFDSGGGSGRRLGMMKFENEAAMSAAANITFLGPVIHYNGVNPWPGNALGCAKHAARCVLSTNDPTTRTAGDTSSAIATAAHSRLLLVYHMAENSWIKRVGSTRSIKWADDDWVGYYGQPKANMSQDGRFVSVMTNSGIVDRLHPIMFAVDSDSKALRVTNRATTTATLRYLAPSVSACTITLSTNSDYSAPILDAVSHSPGTNERAYSLTSLTTATLYYARVTCGGVNADTSFQTR